MPVTPVNERHLFLSPKVADVKPFISIPQFFFVYLYLYFFIALPILGFYGKRSKDMAPTLAKIAHYPKSL
jgi:hypothetical protein